MSKRAVLLLTAVSALLAGAPGCDEDSAAKPPAEAEVRTVKVQGRDPLLGIAEPNAWRRVPPLAGADQIARLNAALGADSHRFVVDWGVVEPQAPEGEHHYDFAEFDEMYRADLRRGIRPLLVVLSAPAWASDPGTRSSSAAHNPPAASRLADWAAFLGAVSRRYPRALGIEIWNEPNLSTFWGGGSALLRPDPTRYAALLKAGYEAIKAANPRLLVVGGALAPTEVSPDGDVPAQDFARAMLGAGAADYMDAFSVHPYPGGGGLAQTLALIDAVRAARDEAGTSLPLWLTELGVTTTGPYGVSEQEQARELVAICRAVSRQEDVDAVYIHTLIERPGPDVSPEPGFGMAEPVPGGTLRPKPALDAVGRAFSPPAGCAGSN